jgi:acetyl esterase/lipase
MLAAAGSAPAPQDIDQRRRSLEDLAELATGEPVEVALVENLRTPLPFGLRRYRHETAGPPLVYLHGGGWTAGSLHTHDSVCRTLAAEGPFEVFAVDYRRAPEHPFPGPIQDAVDAVRWVAAHTGTTPVLAGDSAGGNLAAAAAAELRGEGVRALLLICPILDLANQSASRRAYGEGHFIAPEAFAADLGCYLQGADPADPRASPLHAPVISAWPRTFIHVAEFVPFHDEGAALAERLRSADVPVRLHEHAGMIHYFYALPRLIPHARQALAQAARELRAVVG